MRVAVCWLNPCVLVSVVIPTYRRPQLLRLAVQSVLAQTYRPIELVIVDDGSPDGSFAQVQAMADEIRAAGVTPSLHTKANGGVACARNFGMARATGELIALLDDDDLFMPEKLARQVAAIGTADACVCRVERRRGARIEPYPTHISGLLQGRNPAGVMRNQAWAHTNSLLLRRELLARMGPYNESLKIFEDDEFLWRLAHYANVAALPDVLATWIDHPGSLSQVPDWPSMLRRDENRRRQLEITREACAGLPNWDEAAWRDGVAEAYRQIVNHHIWRGDIAGAKQNLARGFELAGPLKPLRKARRKLWKARLLGLVGLRVRNPKRDPLYD